MEKQTTRTHAEFDLAAAQAAYSQAEKELSGEQITSPFHLYSVERLRDEHGLRTSTSFASDVFVFGIGAPRDRRVTKVSGLPYWPQGRPWPVTAEGAPYQFLAQFCFLDSQDLVGQLPGDMLLLFVPQDDEEWLWETKRIRFEWLSASAEPLIEQLPQGVQPFSKTEWYGVRHRTCDYPTVMEQARKLKVSQPYNLPVLNSTKIGGVPHNIQSKVTYEADPVTGLPVAVSKGKPARRRFLCQLTSIQAAPNVLYPWTNRKKPLTLAFNNSGIYGEDNECMFGDMGSIYVHIDPKGKCAASMECY